MRIIDKNHDFYDYLQDPTDTTITFDRRGSFLLEKSYICDGMWRADIERGSDKNHKFMILQCGNMFWAFLVTATAFDPSYFHDKPLDYNLELITSWKDFDKESKLIDVFLLSIPYRFYKYNGKRLYYSSQMLENSELDRNYLTLDNIKDCLNEKMEDAKHVDTLKVSKETKSGYDYKTYTIPLLNATGIANLVNPLDVFCAIEEYFSMQKTAAERTEAIGTTNNDKIVMHGFDLKTSFRGK